VFHADLLIIADTQIDAMKEYQIATELNPYKQPIILQNSETVRIVKQHR
jgi:hypothetical protein